MSLGCLRVVDNYRDAKRGNRITIILETWIPQKLGGNYTNSHARPGFASHAKQGSIVRGFYCVVGKNSKEVNIIQNVN